MLYHFIRNVCVLSLVSTVFSTYSFLNASLAEITAAERQSLREGLYEALEELRTACDSYHRESLKYYISGLRELLRVPARDDTRRRARELPRPPVDLPPDDLRHVLLAHRYSSHLARNVNSNSSIFSNRISIPYTRNRRYAGIHSVSTREEDDEPLLQSGQEDTAFIVSTAV